MAAFAFDLDGTICFGGRIAPVILDALNELASYHTVIIASARHPVNILDVIPAKLFARLCMVGANGAIGYAAGKRIHAYIMDADVVRLVLNTLVEARCAYLAYGEDFVIPSVDAHATHVAITRDLHRKLRIGSETDLGSVVKVLALPGEQSMRSLLMCRSVAGAGIELHSDGTFDVMKAGVDKAVGIKAVLSPRMRLFAAFGNDTNDLPMFAMCRHAVTVGEHPQLKHLGGLRISCGLDHGSQIAAVIRMLSVKGLEIEP